MIKIHGQFPGTETMTPDSRELIRTIYGSDKLILIDKNEALAFATNAAVLQNTKDNRFKTFVNGDRSTPIPDEINAIATQQISFTSKNIQKMLSATNGTMDIVEVPYSTMHGSGGSVRCSVQEVACTLQSVTPHKTNKHHFSDALDKLETRLYSNNQGNGFFSMKPVVKVVKKAENENSASPKNAY